MDALLGVADEVHFVDVRDAQDFSPKAFRIVVQLCGGEAVALKHKNVRVHVAEFVIEKGTLYAGGQGVGHVADLLAHLVPGIRHQRGRCGVLDREEQHRFARPRIAAQEVDVAGFLQLAHDTVGDFILNLAGGGPWPHRSHHHDLECERRIFRLGELAVGKDPEARHQHQDECDQCLVLQRPTRQVEGGAVHTGAPLRGAPRGDAVHTGARAGAVGARRHGEITAPGAMPSLANRGLIGVTRSPANTVCTPATTKMSPSARPPPTSTERSA